MTDTIKKPDTPNAGASCVLKESAADPTRHSWFERPVPGIKQQLTAPLTAVETEPSTECTSCHSMITNTALIFNCYICPHCDHHMPMSARERLQWFLDQVDGELGQEFSAKDPLKFVDSKPYPDRMLEAQTKTNETEALLVMYGKLRNLDVVACAFDFRFMGGSMGSVVGDRFVQAAETALEKNSLGMFCGIWWCSYARRLAVVDADGTYRSSSRAFENCWCTLYRDIDQPCLWRRDSIACYAW